MRKFDILGILVILSVFCGPVQLVQNELHKGYLRDCRANQNEICIALQAYKRDHSGHGPVRLDDLVPTYLEQLPHCPAAPFLKNDYKFQRLSDGFSLCCQGSNHIGPEESNLHHNHRLGSCDRD